MLDPTEPFDWSAMLDAVEYANHRALREGKLFGVYYQNIGDGRTAWKVREAEPVYGDHLWALAYAGGRVHSGDEIMAWEHELYGWPWGD